MSNRLPIVNSDAGTWGTVLNGFLSYSLVADTTSGTATAQSGAISYVSIVSASTYSIGATGNGGNTSGNETVLCNAASNTVAVTLPSAVTYPGMVHTVKKTDSTANNVTVNSSAGNIDGGSSAVIKVQYVSLTFASDGANWNII